MCPVSVISANTVNLLRCQLSLPLTNLMLPQCRTTFCPKALGEKTFKDMGCILEGCDALKVL